MHGAAQGWCVEARRGGAGPAVVQRGGDGGQRGVGPADAGGGVGGSACVAEGEKG